MSSHDHDIHATFTERNSLSLIDIHDQALFIVEMKNVGQRIQARIDQLGKTQSTIARATGLSTARLNNYIKGVRPPDIDSLAKLAVALRTTTDWLLGLSENVPIDTKAVIFRLLELDGMDVDRAELIAQVATEALRLLSSLPDGGDSQMRALLAAQAAWQVRDPAKPD